MFVPLVRGQSVEGHAAMGFASFVSLIGGRACFVLLNDSQSCKARLFVDQVVDVVFALLALDDLDIGVGRLVRHTAHHPYSYWRRSHLAVCLFHSWLEVLNFVANWLIRQVFKFDNACSDYLI